MKLKKALLFLSIILFAAGCSENKVPSTSKSLVVSVTESPYFEVTSKNPITIKKGDRASFRLNFNEGYGFESAGEASFSNGLLVLENVTYSQSINVVCGEYYTVKIEPSIEGKYIIKSQNPVKVKKGESATFDISFANNYVFESCSEGEYSNGKLTINNVSKATTISIAAKLKGTIHLTIKNDTNLGKMLINGEEKYEDYGNDGDIVFLEAVPIEGAKFVCWTITKDLKHAMPFSFDKQISFTFSEDITLHANYWYNNENTIIYDGNEGTTSSGEKLIYYPNYKYDAIRFNTLQGSKAFYKEGYYLDSWNTEADGSGERIGLGSRYKIKSPTTPDTLYAQWLEITDADAFTFELNEDETAYELTNCTSQDEKIVLPNAYNDLPITKIKSDSFNNLPLKALYLNEDIIEVESGALIDCNNFDEIHFFDSLDIIPDDFYIGNNPSYVYINANTDPCYIGSYQTLFARKVDLLLEKKSKKFIFVGNSNCLYSIDGEMMTTNYGIDSLAFGVQDGVGVAWELAMINKYCQNDDNNIIFCGEFFAYNSLIFTEHKFFAAESNYDMLAGINFNEINFKQVFTAYSLFKSLKKDSNKLNYGEADFWCDEYGCIKLKVEPTHSDDWCFSQFDIDYNFYKNGKFKWIENYCQKFKKSEMLFSFCSFNKNCIKEEERDEFYGSYQQSIIDNISFPVISSLKDYAFSGSAFLDDNFHLIYSYAVTRTNSLIHDINLYYGV